MIEFDIKLTSRDMYRFNMYQAYTGTQGWISILSAVLVFAVAWTRHADMEASKLVMYLVFGILLLIYLPAVLYMRSKQSLAASPALRESLHYCVDEDGIHVSQGEAAADLKWNQIYRMVATKSNVLVYSNRINAYVIPREQLGEKYVTLSELANKNLEKHRVKMR